MEWSEIFSIEDNKKSLLFYIKIMDFRRRRRFIPDKPLRLYSREIKLGELSVPITYVMVRLLTCDDNVPDEYLDLLELPLGLTYRELVLELTDFPKDW